MLADTMARRRAVIPSAKSLITPSWRPMIDGGREGTGHVRAYAHTALGESSLFRLMAALLPKSGARVSDRRSICNASALTSRQQDGAP